MLRISPYSVWMRENVDQNNSEYDQFLRSVLYKTNDWTKNIIIQSLLPWQEWFLIRVTS